MAASLEKTKVEFAEAPAAVNAAPWWEKPALILILCVAASLLVAWVLFLGWIVSLLVFAAWP